MFGSVLSALLVLHNYSMIISECQKVTFLVVEAKKIVKMKEKNKVTWNCLIWRENWFLTIFLDKYGRVAAAYYGEARAHARPVRRGARSTPRGYAPLESSGNGCLWQPMQTFFYCDSHDSQQRGKTPRVKFLVNNFKKHFRSIFSPNRAILSNFFFFFHLTNFFALTTKKVTFWHSEMITQ